MSGRQRAFLGVVIALVVGIALLAPHGSKAQIPDLVVFEFQGEITDGCPISVPGVQVGDPFVATLSYDPAQAPTVVGPVQARYPDYAFSLTVLPVGATFTADPTSFLDVFNDHWAAADALITDGTDLGFAGFNLKDSTGDVFTSTDLPHTLNIEDFGAIHWVGVGGCWLMGRIDSISLGIQIDLKPGSDPNCFNNDGHGIIPVAILTSDTFDAATVDPLTVMLDGAAARVKGKSGNAGSLEDVDNDGDLDLVVQIADVDGIYQVGDTVATLTGSTYDGTPIVGQDSLCVVP